MNPNFTPPVNRNPSMEQQISHISHTLTHLIHEIKHHGRLLSPCNHTKQKLPQQRGSQRDIPLKYAKVNEINNKVTGIEIVKVARHYMDDSQMKKALQWDDKSEFIKPRIENNSNTIRIQHNFGKNISQSKSSNNLLHQKTIKLSQSPKASKEMMKIQEQQTSQNPAFNNEFIKMKTSQASNPNLKFSTSRDNPKAGKNSNKLQNYKSQPSNKGDFRNTKHSGDQVYRKKTIIEDRDHSLSQSNSTDSEFSLYQ